MSGRKKQASNAVRAVQIIAILLVVAASVYMALNRESDKGAADLSTFEINGVSVSIPEPDDFDEMI